MKKNEVTKHAGPLDVALDNAHEFAAQIGILISCFALVERYLPQLVSRLTGIKEEDAFVFTGSFGNFSQRIELLKTLVENRPSASDEKTAVQFFIPRLKEATQIRNKYAHAQYSYMTPTQFMIDSFLNDAKRPKKSVVHSLEDVRNDTFIIKHLINELHGYIYRNEMPGKKPFESGKN